MSSVPIGLSLPINYSFEWISRSKERKNSIALALVVIWLMEWILVYDSYEWRQTVRPNGRHLLIWLIFESTFASNPSHFCVQFLGLVCKKSTKRTKHEIQMYFWRIIMFNIGIGLEGQHTCHSSKYSNISKNISYIYF